MFVTATGDHAAIMFTPGAVTSGWKYSKCYTKSRVLQIDIYIA